MTAGILEQPQGVRGNDAVQQALAKSLLGAAKPASVLWRPENNSARRVRLFGLAIENTTLTSAARDLALSASTGRRTRVVFANAHSVNTAMASDAYRGVIGSADRIYADGSGMAVAALLAGQPLADNVNGTDLFPLLCEEAIAARTRIFLLGGKPGVAARAARNVKAFGMGDAIAGTHHGYFSQASREEDAVIATINASRAGILLVGLGVPLQDEWAKRNAPRLDSPVIAGVGGLFDFFAGDVSRSPKIMRTAGCEWMWRLAMEPRRMAHRYLAGNAVFLAHALTRTRQHRMEHRLRPA